MKKKLMIFVIALFMCAGLFFSSYNTTSAVAYEDLSAGTYTIDAKLSCYVPAMGGVEFGDPLLTSTTLTIDDSGRRVMKLEFRKSSVTIYAITCDTFIDADPSHESEDRGVENGTIGYYDQDGNLQTEEVAYTLSDDTALNPADKEVHYVDSITFPITHKSDQYALTFYINSNVMGVQFCNENAEATASTYPAILSVDWSGVSGQGSTSPTGGQPSEEQEPESGGDATVVEEDGLNIHEVDGVSSAVADRNVSESTDTPYVNTKVLTIIGVCAGALLFVGLVLLVLSKKVARE